MALTILLDKVTRNFLAVAGKEVPLDNDTES